MTQPIQRGRFIINLIGPTGSGKSTLGAQLSTYYKIPHISLGDLFRDILRHPALPLAKVIQFQAQERISDEVDEVCIGMLLCELAKPQYEKGVILDGFPRSVRQANVLIRVILSPQDHHIPLVLQVENEVVINRIAQRFFCNECCIQIREHENPKKEGKCPRCTQILTRRADDERIDVVRRKLEQYTLSKEALIETLMQRDVVHRISISVDHTVDNVAQMAKEQIDDTLRREIAV